MQLNTETCIRNIGNKSFKIDYTVVPPLKYEEKSFQHKLLELDAKNFLREEETGGSSIKLHEICLFHQKEFRKDCNKCKRRSGYKSFFEKKLESEKEKNYRINSIEKAPPANESSTIGTSEKHAVPEWNKIKVKILAKDPEPHKIARGLRKIRTEAISDNVNSIKLHDICLFHQK